MQIVQVGPVNKEFFNLVVKWVPLLDIPLSRIYVCAMPDDMRDGEKTAETHIEPDYVRASIYVDPDIGTLNSVEYDLEEIAMHELVHIILDPIAGPVQDLVNSQRHSAILANQFRDEVEAATTRLSRSLLAVSRAQKKPLPTRGGVIPRGRGKTPSESHRRG